MVAKSGFVRITVCFIFSLTMVAWAGVSLLNEKGDEITLKFQAPQYTIGSQVVNGEVCATISATSEPPTFEKGYPEVPYFVQSVLIGNDNLVSLEVVNVRYKEIPCAKIVPSRGHLSREINPELVPYTFGSVYTQDSWYPEKTASISEPFILRDVRGVTVTFNPFQYNAARGVLRVAEEMVVLVKTVGTARSNVLSSDPVITSIAFNTVYEDVFINYTPDRFRADVPDGDKMIIIGPDKYKVGIEPFVQWKNRKGIKTTFYSTTEAGSTGAALKTFIKGKYDSDKITYVLLLGDYADVSSIAAGGGKSDPSFTLVGADVKYPAVFVGRFSVETTDQLATIVNKSISYEKAPDPNATWYGNAILNGSSSTGGSPVLADYQWMEFFADSLKKAGYLKPDIYSQSGAGGHTAGTAATTSAAINAGASWFNYMGHGSQTSQTAPSYSSSNITSLTNANKYPVCISVACFNGQFDNTTCIGETWIRAGSATSGKGGIVYVGSYISQVWVPPQYGMAGMMSMIKQGKSLSVGNIVYNGEIRMIIKYPNNTDGSTFLTWTYFGDPSIYLIFKKPSPITLTHPAILAAGSQTFDVTGPDNIMVCVYSGAQNIWQSKAISGGRANFTVTVTNASDTLFVTGVGQNMVPYLGSINAGSTNISDNKTLQTGAKAGITKGLNGVIFSFPKQSAVVAVTVYGVNGKLVYSNILNAGLKVNSMNWNFTNSNGAQLAKGMYHVSMNITMSNGVVSSINKTLMHF